MALDLTIVRASIHPGIGVARVGNSLDDFVVAPEVHHPPPMPRGFLRDSSGALKREAARFRIYGYNARGQVVQEITASNATVEWEVELANSKSAWYQFQIALDVPEAVSAAPSLLRNPNITDRDRLAIRPGLRRISGVGQHGAAYRFDSGTFGGKPVYLGEVRTDDHGRLLVLGGRGVSASVDGTPATTFANNDGWYDDTSDGPVRARVTSNGVSIPVESAWVVVAPPNYGPEMKSVRTMKDLLEDVYVQAGMMSFPSSISFTEHILPILARQTSLQWANKGFAAQFGWGGTACADNLEWIAKLSSPGETWAELRQQVANSFRRHERDGTSPQPWPWLYGDAMDVPPANTPRQHSTLTKTQLRMLEHWAAGRFINDWDPTVLPPADLAKMPLSLQPTMLDEAAMDNCLADAFHPGCELTWPMRHATLFRAPFRIREASAGAASKAKYGAQLTQETALSIDGPLYAQSAGDLTRWMAVPWQTDTASCRGGYYAGYGPRYDPFLPTFWPARVPNQVLTEEDYQKAINPGLSREERISAFAKRESWFRTLGPGGYESQINRMISNFADMGIIESRPGIPGDKDLPPVMQVENRVAPAPAAGAAHARLEDHIEPFNSENEASLRALRAIGDSEH